MSGRRNHTELFPASGRSNRRNQEYSSQPLVTSRRPEHRFASQAVARGSQDLDETQTEDSDLIQNSVTSAVRAALRLASSGKPFKKTDLLLGSGAKKRYQIERTITLAKQKLITIYGVELVEVSSGKYILVLPKTAPFREDLAARSGVAPSAFSSMLGIVLTLIYIQKGRLSEEYLKNTMLPKLFPDIRTTIPHPYFGNVDKLIQEFEQQAYITKETEMRDGEPSGYLVWGIRAEREINKQSLVVPVMSAMFGGHNNIPDSLLNDLESNDDVECVDLDG